jgi:pyrroloquinoline quinone biosynthesis protein B
MIVNASPDLRQQITSTPALWPRQGSLRNSPLNAILLTGGEVDNVAGLLTLRERQPFFVWATATVQATLDANPIFEALDRSIVERRALVLDQPIEITGPAGALGLTVTAFAVPGKVPLYLEKKAATLAGTPEETIGLEISCGTTAFHYIPGCARLTPDLRGRLQGSAVLFFDGTVWSDDEMITAGLGTKTGLRMGHISMSGPDGSMAALNSLGIARKIFIHINNSNPVLLPDSAERDALDRAGWELAEDGLEITL